MLIYRVLTNCNNFFQLFSTVICRTLFSTAEMILRFCTHVLTLKSRKSYGDNLKKKYILLANFELSDTPMLFTAKCLNAKEHIEICNGNEVVLNDCI